MKQQIRVKCLHFSSQIIKAPKKELPLFKFEKFVLN